MKSAASREMGGTIWRRAPRCAVSRALRTAAALALAVLAVAALPDRPAEAQTPTYDVWTATLFVDTHIGYAGCHDFTGRKNDTCASALSDNSFTYSGSTYSFKTFYIDNDIRPHHRALHVTFDKAIPANVRNALSLHVGSVSFALSSANWRASDSSGRYSPSDRTLDIANPGFGPWRDEQTVSLRLAAADTVRPAKPSGFSATPGNGRVKLTWDNPDDPTIIKYQVHMEKPGTTGTWQDVPGSGPGTTSHTVTGLSNGALYTFRVRAVDNGGPGLATNHPGQATPRAPASRTQAPAQAFFRRHQAADSASLRLRMSISCWRSA